MLILHHMHLVTFTLEMSRIFPIRNVILQKVFNDVTVLVVHNVLSSSVIISRGSIVSKLRLILVTLILLMGIDATDVRLHLAYVTALVLLDLNLTTNATATNDLGRCSAVRQISDLS